ncbi:hypothetical protein [Methylobacterium brachythecii]|uniref:Uncharacterized protein n=1 Tax=Methylobacterium brachythecii TaxID=1176177 RepID=A0A7W6F8N0_9HYPH|nr:hypothetical protein [Methylobacterium brachythecii]MBB3904638.1 hypothetical protein [Methylobacterium brachythecii]GLS45016.1 hypothetical protein GCM10007884_30050 [Methylobacterium brachythecii]
MKRRGLTVIGTAAIAAIVATTFALRPHRDQPNQGDRAETAKSEAAAKAAVPTLYCEFTNFADRTPLVGFYFTIDGDAAKPDYSQIFQREQDGTTDDFGGPAAPRPQWSFNGGESPAILHSPDDSMQINLYEYDPKKPGSNWFEAGLRSVRYRNLGGKCRHSAA